MGVLMATTGILPGVASVFAALVVLHPVGGGVPPELGALLESHIAVALTSYARAAASGGTSGSSGAVPSLAAVAAAAREASVAVADMEARLAAEAAEAAVAQGGGEEAEELGALHDALARAAEAAARARRLRDLLARCSASSLRFDLDEDTLREALRTAPRGTAGGGSGWLTEHLRGFSLDGGDAGFRFVHTVLQQVARGSVPPVVGEALAASIGVPLDKDGLGINPRPLALGEVIHRAAFRAVCRQCGFDFESVLSPLQYGVNVRGGAEQISLALQLLLAQDPSRIIIQVDVKNAFNSLNKATFFHQILEHFPHLLGAVGAFYLGSGNLYYRRDDGGVEVLSSVSGVRQGDPLGPVLFALGIHPALLEVDRLFRCQGVIILAYADDIHLVGPPDATYAAFDLLRRLLGPAEGFPLGFPSVQPAGLTISAGKCWAWGPSGIYPEGMATDPHVKVAPEGLTALGLPVATAVSMESATLARVMGLGKPRQWGSRMRALDMLAEHGGLHGFAAALRLKEVTADPCLVYPLRCLLPSITMAAAAAADARSLDFFGRGIDASVVEQALLAPGGWRAASLSLPRQQHFGGHNYTRAVAIAPIAFTGGWLANAPALLQRVPELQGAIAPIYAALQAGLRAAVDAAPPAADGAGTRPARATVCPGSSSLVAVARRAALAALEAALPADISIVPSPSSEALVALQKSVLAECVHTIVTPARADILTAAAELTVERGPQPGWQHSLTMAAAPAAYAEVAEARLREDPDSPAAAARFQARAEFGAVAFSAALPLGGRASLAGEELVWTYRQQLRLPIPGFVGGSRCPRCASAALDVYGDHADECKGEGMPGLHIRAHDQVRDTVYAMARRAGVRDARIEPQRLVEGTQERPADVLLPGSLGLGEAHQRGMVCCLDVVRVNSLALSYIGQRPLRGPVEAAVRAKDRRTGLPQHIFAYGFGVSSLGFIHERRGRAVLAALAAHRSGGAGAPEGAGEALAAQQWLPMLSVAVHRGSYLRTRALLGDAAGVGGGVQPFSDIQFRGDGTTGYHTRRRRRAAGSVAGSTHRVRV